MTTHNNPKKHHDYDLSVSFCINEACPLYGKKGKNNIRMKGHFGKDRKLHELICTCCHKAFSENYGTPFYNSHLPKERVLDIVRHLLEGCGIRGTARLLKHHPDTIVRCLRKVAIHLLGVLNSLLNDLGCAEIQMDEFWAFVRKKEKNASAKEKLNAGFGDRWIHLAMDAASRLIIAWNVDRRTQKATDALVSDLAARLKDPLDALYTSDQHGPYKIALEALKTTEEARRQGTDGPGTEAGAPPHKPGMVYATVKKTYQKGRPVHVERTQEMGTLDDLRQRLDESPVSNDINTSFVERLNNTFRQDVRRVTRKTLSFSKESDVLEAHVVLETANYNLVHHHSGLTVTEKRSDGSTVKLRRTPAMAAGLADAPWTLLDLLTYTVNPLNPSAEVDSKAA